MKPKLDRYIYVFVKIKKVRFYWYDLFFVASCNRD
ncbi:unnamed protein product [Tenebrio molitor]|nr:unnamed protein product [Tenebrio molitor]